MFDKSKNIIVDTNVFKTLYFIGAIVLFTFFLGFCMSFAHDNEWFNNIRWNY